MYRRRRPPERPLDHSVERITLYGRTSRPGLVALVVRCIRVKRSAVALPCPDDHRDNPDGGEARETPEHRKRKSQSYSCSVTRFGVLNQRDSADNSPAGHDDRRNDRRPLQRPGRSPESRHHPTLGEALVSVPTPGWRASLPVRPLLGGHRTAIRGPHDRSQAGAGGHSGRRSPESCLFFLLRYKVLFAVMATSQPPW